LKTRGAGVLSSHKDLEAVDDPDYEVKKNRVLEL
jgi:hypothetical protein